jgi:asparagine synthase (glutamine-hydrolysing)
MAEGMYPMSGICGMWRKDGGHTPETLRLICENLSPDHTGAIKMSVADEVAGLGVSAQFPGQQLHQDSRILLACDTELINLDELRGLVAVPAGDGTAAALLAALYERFGNVFVDKLRGDFSIVLWDRTQRRLLAATDPFGIRSLAYYEDDSVLMVASRIDALAASGAFTREINPGAIANYLNFTVNLGPSTILTNVNRLLPGHMLVASKASSSARKYWDMQYVADTHSSEEELSRRLEAVVEGAVRANAMGESFSEVGAFLSGGTDSSTVAGMMSRMQRGPARTFSIGFEEERFNELEYARIAARKFGADHHEYLVTASDCAEALPNMIRQFDEPFGNSSAIPTYFCARLASHYGVRTLLAGDGGDELFGGNERYLTNSIFEVYGKVPKILRRGLIEPALRAIPLKNGVAALARSYVRRASLPQPDRFFSYNLLLDNPLSQIFEPDFLNRLENRSVLERPRYYYQQGPAQDQLNRLLYLDVKVTLGDNDLPKVTQMSELAGVRTRFPFLDRAVAEFSGLIPAGLKVKGTEKRYLFKKAFRNLLPIEVIQKKKHGFGIPVAFWMKSDPRMKEITCETLLSTRTYERGYIRRSFVEDLMRKHQTDGTAFYGDTLWTFLTLELWFRQFIDEPRKALV